MRAGRGAAGSGSTCGAASSGRDRHQNLHFFTHGAGMGRVPDAGGEPICKRMGKISFNRFPLLLPLLLQQIYTQPMSVFPWLISSDDNKPVSWS